MAKMTEEVNKNVSDLTLFNEKVIAKISESIDEEDGRVKLLGIDLSNPNNAITYINLGDVPALVIVKLDEDETGKVPLYDRVSDVIMTLTFNDIKSVEKLINWCTVIHNNLQAKSLNDIKLNEVV